MSDAKKNEEARQGKSAAAIAELDASEQGTATPAAAPEPKHEEKSGVGADNTIANIQSRIALQRSKLKKAKEFGNTAMVSKITERIAALQKEVADHKSK